jgi:hypothetical protein
MAKMIQSRRDGWKQAAAKSWKIFSRPGGTQSCFRWTQDLPWSGSGFTNSLGDLGRVVVVGIGENCIHIALLLKIVEHLFDAFVDPAEGFDLNRDDILLQGGVRTVRRWS